MNMMQIVFLCVCLIGGYLLGSLNASIIFSKAKGDDIRSKGSKNAGMTNTLRIFGIKAAVFVFLFDVVKAVASLILAGFFARLCFSKSNSGIPFSDFSLYSQYLAGLGAVLGHNFPVYFKFRGGKGILASWGVIMMLDYRIALLLLLVFLLVVITTRYVSLASICSAASYPVFVVMLNIGHIQPTTIYYIALALALAVLAVYRHRHNIVRLRAGVESKLGEKKNKE